MTAAAITDFLNFKFLMVGIVKKVEVCHRAKFHKNRLNRSRDMVIFIFFKMVATAILDFQNLHFSTLRTVKRLELHHYAKFRRNHLNCGRDMVPNFSIFQDGGGRPLGFSKFEIFNCRNGRVGETALVCRSVTEGKI